MNACRLLKTLFQCLFVLLTLAWPAPVAEAAGNTALQIATFSADVTPPLGTPLMGGGIAPARSIGDPLQARGCVILGGGEPVVLLAVDWCEIRSEAHDRWRTVLAVAANTDPSRVLVTSVHVHDAPIADLQAQRLLEKNNVAGSICPAPVHEAAVQATADALRQSLRQALPLTHIGTGQARVQQVASNRRYLQADGTPAFDRYSATKKPLAQSAPEGTIDPWLKTLSFWNGRKAVAAIHAYSVHPMSHYGKGEVSADFVGMARARRQADDPGVFQIYASGCSGNVTAGKYNDGSPENRPVLADRVYQAMTDAWKATRRVRVSTLQVHSAMLELAPRTSPGFTENELRGRLLTDPKPFGQCLAAMGLSWRQRADSGRRLDVPAVDFGRAQLLLLPAESYVEYQLYAQQQRPESFVMVWGYGDCAPGYIPTERAWAEGDTNLHDWCWIDPGAEGAMQQAIAEALGR